MKMGRVSGIDSGNETEEGSPDSDLVSVATTPHNFSDRINQDKCVIRPVAFKPMGLPKGTNGPRYGSTPSLARPGSILTLYGSSSDLRQRRNYSLDRKRGCSPMTMSSLPLASDSGQRSLGYESLDSIYTPTPSLSKEHYRLGRASEVGLPRVSSIEPNNKENELELALRERDSELQYLRQTMSDNEQAIIRVHQDKERAWHRDMARLKELHEARLHKATSKALRLEQMLIMHTYQLQQDKKRLREEADRAEEEACHLRKELEGATGRLDETEWTLCQKSGEIALLKSQLKDIQAELSTKCQDIINLKSELRELKTILESRDLELNKMKEDLEMKDNTIKEFKIDQLKLSVDDTDKIPEKGELDENEEETIKLPESLVDGDPDDENRIDYQADLLKLEATLSRERSQWELERQTWAEEKEKVINYQRQLQINYVQMYKRTQYLEQELDSARMAAASTEKLAAISSTSIQL